MPNSSLPLIHQPGCVFETNDFGQRWVAGSAEDGLVVQGTGSRVNQALVEFSFVLPPLSASDPGLYPVFILARGTSAGRYWFPCEGEHENSGEGTGGVFFRLTYEPARGLFHCGMNAGTPKRKPYCLALGPAPVEEYTGRVLRAFILVAPSGLYPSIEASTIDQPDLFGELQLPRRAGASGFPPWGVAPTGPWWITSGPEVTADQGEESFPPGFGLSDVRVLLSDPSADNFGMLPYSGALDHLASGSDHSEDWPADLEDGEEPLSELLQGFADQLTGLVGTTIDWASRALDLADETDELAIRLAEEHSEEHSQEHSEEDD